MDLLQSEITLHEDIPCAACGYNLRGLQVPGKCPECGANLNHSIQEFDAARRLARPVDRVWARQILEGAVLSLLGFGLVLAIELLPWWMWIRRPDRRIWPLMIWSCCWVLAHWSVLKLSRAEPLLYQNARPTLLWFLRGCTVVYATIPFIGEMFTRIPTGLGVATGLGTLLSGIVASALLYVRVRQFAGRLNSVALSVQATLLAFIMPFMVATAFMPSRRVVQEPVTALQALPLLQFGAPEFIQNWLRRAIGGRFNPIECIQAGIVLAAVLVFLQLAVLIIRAPKINLEAHERRSSAS